jgi:hypothetical protein
LLTAEKKLSRAEIKLAGTDGQIYSSARVPLSAGNAQSFFHDYEGFPDLICSDSIFRIDVWNNELQMLTIPAKTFSRGILPVADTAHNHLYFSNAWPAYPAFDYFSIKSGDSAVTLLKHIENTDLMKLYNLEYYYLPSRMQLEARRLAKDYKTQPQIIAALMSGFTKSMYYDPVYAPLYVMNDTLLIFNHHNDHLYHYSSDNRLIDSVSISYHHPKNWKEWKKKLLTDEVQNRVYALFSKDGHHYLKEIDIRSGQVRRTYKLLHHSAEKIKIRDGYAYYVYRPFESTQEKFLYREFIR